VSEIEVLLRAPLPAASGTPGWWQNGQASRPQAQAWLAAGWRVAAVTRGSRATVTFVRAEPVAHPAAPAAGC
jgi:hypothetical protein